MRSLPWATIVALILVCCAVVLFSRATHFSPSRLEGSDIKAIWDEGQRICDGKNPYSRIHKEGIRTIRKPPIYFPGFYLFECALDGLGVDSFAQFVPLWWKLNFLLLLAIALTYYLSFERAGMPLIGLSCMAVWLFGRWGMYGLYTLQTNFAGMLPLLWSLLLMRSWPRTAMLLFGVSLALKQVAIFLLPLYVIAWCLRHEGRISVRGIVVGALLAGGIPALVSLPFLVDDPTGFFNSIVYSAQRIPAGGMPFVKSLGLSSLSVMLLSMAAIYGAALCRRVTLVQGSALIFLCFISLNGTFFRQYLLWFLLVVPLLIPHPEKFLQKNEPSVARC